MNFKKLLTPIITCLALLFAIIAPSTAEAAYLITLSQTGPKYIYSNNPESINSSQLASPYYGRYTVYENLTGGQEYISEFYHHNYTGASLRMGVAIKNNNSYTSNVTVYNKAILAGAYTLETATSVLRDYGNSTNYQTISIPAYSTVTILYGDAASQQIINGKVRFVPQYSNMTARVFFVATSSYNANNIFNFSLATPADPATKLTSGVFANAYRTASVDAATTTSFYLSAYTDNYNEYQTGWNVAGSSKLLGNYGVIYDITLRNAAGKRIKITPNLASTGATQSQIVLWTAANSWYRTTYVNDNSTTKYWLMAVPSDGRFKFTLPGGNFGNVLFEIIN